MKLSPDTQWFLGAVTDPADWLAGLRRINLPEIPAFLVSVRQLSADMAALALHAPPIDPAMHPANVIRPRPTTADKGKQAERTQEEPAKVSADEESPANKRTKHCRPPNVPWSLSQASRAKAKRMPLSSNKVWLVICRR